MFILHQLSKGKISILPWKSALELATRTQRKVSEVVMEFPIELNGLLTKVDLNILHLGYYDVLIGMDWLERHTTKLYFYEKFLDYIDDEGRTRVVKG